MDKKTGAEDSAESERLLKRVADEAETVGQSSLARIADRARDHMTAAEADQDDPAEIWGRRVGRGLSLIAFIVLAIWLFNYLSR